MKKTYVLLLSVVLMFITTGNVFGDELERIILTTASTSHFPTGRSVVPVDAYFIANDNECMLKFNFYANIGTLNLVVYDNLSEEVENSQLSGQIGTETVVLPSLPAGNYSIVLIGTTCYYGEIVIL